MRPDEIAARLPRIIALPVGAWVPPLDQEIARRVITFLEDRRVLFNTYDAESPKHCIDSMLNMRKFLTDALGEPGASSELVDSLRAMRGACHKFLASVPGDLSADETFGGGPAVWEFNQALGELRAAYGFHIAFLAVKYNVEVHEPLAGIIPAAD